MLITIFNPEVDQLEKTYLTEAEAAGSTALSVRNNDNFSGSNRVMVGEQGQEKTEVVTSSGITGSESITVGATDFSHEADAPVTKLRYDQIKIYRSTTGINGTYSLLATVDIEVDNEELATHYDDTTGTASYYYKFTYYNSLSTVETERSDPIQGSGWKRNQVGYILDEVLREVGDEQEQQVSRLELIGYMNDVNDDLTTHASRPFSFLKTREAFSRTADRNYLDYPTDDNGDQKMWKFDRMDYNYTDTSTDPDTDRTYTLNVMDIEEFENTYTDNTISSVTVDDEAQDIALDDAVKRFRYYPPSETNGSAVFYLYYWKFFDRIDSEGDEIETPTPRIYKLYLKHMYYNKRSVSEPKYSDRATTYLNDYLAEKVRYTGHNRKNQGTPRSFRRETRTIRTFRRR